MKSFRLLIAAGCALLINACARSYDTKSDNVVVDTEFCELARNSSQFDQKLIRIHGVAIPDHTYETVLTNDACPKFAMLLCMQGDIYDSREADAFRKMLFVGYPETENRVKFSLTGRYFEQREPNIFRHLCVTKLDHFELE